MGLFDNLFGGDDFEAQPLPEVPNLGPLPQFQAPGAVGLNPYTHLGVTQGPSDPYAHSQLVASLRRLNNNPTRFFGGQTFADTTPELAQGLGMQRDAANAQQSFMAPSQGLFQKTVGGDFLDPQYLQRLAQPAIDQAVGAVGAQQNLGGGRGGSLAAEAAGRGATNALMNTYNQERGRQQDALGLLPTMTALNYQPGEALAGVGREQMGLNQRQITEDMNRFAFNQQAPWDDLRQFQGLTQPLQQMALQRQGLFNQYQMGGADVAGGNANRQIDTNRINAAQNLADRELALRRAGMMRQGVQQQNARAYEQSQQPSAFGNLLGMAAPMIGTALGGPLGGMLGGALFGGGGGGGGGLPPMTGI